MTQRKRLSQISGLLTTSIDNTPIADPLPNDQDDTTGMELFLWQNIHLRMSEIALL